MSDSEVLLSLLLLSQSMSWSLSLSLSQDQESSSNSSSDDDDDDDDQDELQTDDTDCLFTVLSANKSTRSILSTTYVLSTNRLIINDTHYRYNSTIVVSANEN